MGTRSINIPKSDILSELRSFAHKKDMSIDESLWPNRIKMVGTVTESLLSRSRKFNLPLGPHFEINLSFSSDVDSPSSTLVSVYAKPTTRGRVFYWSIIAASYLLIGIGCFWSVMKGTPVYLIVCCLASSPLWPFGSAVSDRLNWAETWFWRNSPKLASSSNILSTETSAKNRSGGFIYSISTILSPLIATLGIMMLFYAVFDRSYDNLELFVVVMGGIFFLATSPVILAQRLPLLLQLRFIEIFKCTLIYIALSGPLWLFFTFTQSYNVVQNVPLKLDAPIWEIISPSSLSASMMGLFIVAFFQAIFIYSTGFITISIQARLSRQIEYLYSTQHMKSLREIEDEQNRNLFLILGLPLTAIQAITWICSVAGIILLVIGFFGGKADRFYQFIVASGTSVLNHFARHGFVERLENVPSLTGAILGLGIVAFLMLPWIIPISLLLTRMKLLRNTKSYSFNPVDLYSEPTIAGDMKLAAKSITNAELELRWDIDERTARYERIGRNSWAIIIDPKLWAAAKSGDLTPLRFAIYHEAAHIRHMKSQMRWELIKWICLPLYSSARILRSPGLKEEFEADLIAAKYLGGRTTVIETLEQLKAGCLEASYNFSIKRYWRIILDAFLLDTVYFTPHPKIRALYLKDYSQGIKSQSSMKFLQNKES